MRTMSRRHVTCEDRRRPPEVLGRGLAGRPSRTADRISGTWRKLGSPPHSGPLAPELFGGLQGPAAFRRAPIGPSVAHGVIGVPAKVMGARVGVGDEPAPDWPPTAPARLRVRCRPTRATRSPATEAGQVAFHLRKPPRASRARFSCFMRSRGRRSAGRGRSSAPVDVFACPRGVASPARLESQGPYDTLAPASPLASMRAVAGRECSGWGRGPRSP